MRQLAMAVATAGVLHGIGEIQFGEGDHAFSLNKVTVKNGLTDNIGKNLVDDLACAVLTSSITGTDLQTNIRTEVVSSVLNAAAAQGAKWIGDVNAKDKLNIFAHTFAHAVAGCMAGAAGASASGSGISGGKACGAGTIGAAVGELSAQLYNSGNGDAPAKKDTVAFASMMGSFAAALTGQNAQGVAIASGTAANAAQNNYLAHTDAQRLQQLEWDRARGQCGADCQQEIQALKAKDVSSDQALAACQGVQSAHCGEVRQQVRTAAAGYARSNDACVGANCGPVFANSPTGFGTLNYQSGKTQQLALDTMSGTTWGGLAGAKDAVGSTIGGAADLVWTGIKTIWDPTARGEISANFDALGHVISTPSLWKYAAGALTPSQREQLAKDYESGNGYAASKALGEQDANILMTVAPGPDVPKMAAVLNDASKVGKAVEDVGGSATKGTATRVAEQRGWKPATELTLSEANQLLEQSLPSGVKIDNVGSADTVNTSARLKGYDDPLIAGTNVVDVTTTQATHFVRVFLEGSKSEQAGSWVMRADDIAGLTPSQIASKYSLPQVPDMIADVTIPSGAKMQVSVANNILKGADSGGGGVQYQIKSIPNNPIQFSKWFSNARPLE